MLLHAQTQLAAEKQKLPLPGGTHPFLKEKIAKPVVPFALERLPSYGIEPQHRWQQSMRLLADGWIGRAAQIKHPQFYSMLWTRDWTGADYSSAEDAANIAGGYVRLARYVPDSKLALMYQSDWLPQVLKSQMANGYLGAGQTDAVVQHGAFKHSVMDPKIPRYELLNVDLLLESLLWEYEFSGNPAVFEAALKLKDFALQNYLNTPKEPKKDLQTPHWRTICRSLTEMYRYTGDTNILKVLTQYIENQEGALETQFMNKKPDQHMVSTAYALQVAVNMFHYTGNQKLLDNALSGFDNLSNYALQVTGVPTGQEITLPKGCRQYTEHCNTCEWIKVCNGFLSSRGEVRFADAAERCMHNAYFGSKSPDGLSLTYFHTLNQLFATDWTGEYLTNDHEPTGKYIGAYKMRHLPKCCNAMTSKGFAQFVENATMQTPEGELTFVYYGPSTVRAALPNIGPVSIVQDTDYPYEDQVRFTLALNRPAEFPLRFRIPAWCRSARLTVNDEPVDEPLASGTFARINRTWKNGDRINLSFDFPITLDWDKTLAVGKSAGKGAAVVRGPLVYALPIKDEWQYTGTEPAGPKNMNESWNVVMDGKGTAWNIALEINKNKPETSLRTVKLDVPPGSHPWEYPPVGLQVQARLLPDWTLDRISNNPCTPALPLSIKPHGEAFPVTLVPFGFTRLRMTVLPIIDQESVKDEVLVRPVHDT